MKKAYFLFLISIAWVTVTAQDSSKRYRDNLFASIDKQTVAYGSNVNYLDQQENLLADVYTAAGDTLTKKAMIIYLHGGGFKSGHRDDTACVELCKKLAQKGYVTASVDYRAGYSETTTQQQITAMLRAVQDLNGFVRYAKANADSFNIDTAKIFITGSSAGAITVLAKAYFKIDTLALSLGITSLNDLEGNTNDLAYSSSVAAVFSMWGALYDTGWIHEEDIPVGCVHSSGDVTVPFVSGYNKQNTSLLLFGSQSIYNRASNVGIKTALHVYTSGKHDLGIKVSPYKDSTVQLIADFFYTIMWENEEKASFLQRPNRDQQLLSTSFDAVAERKIISFHNIRKQHHAA
ncbi:hypothetical protein BH10BAC2_BH10BAC2_28190 [soil metagenome]